MSDFFQLINVSKTFDVNKKVKVLKNLTFNFKKGKIYSIVGPSGSGKSTLLNILSLIDRPTNGHVKLENTDIKFKAYNCKYTFEEQRKFCKILERIL